jgi:hypothetical protein
VVQVKYLIIDAAPHIGPNTDSDPEKILPEFQKPEMPKGGE